MPLKTQESKSNNVKETSTTWRAKKLCNEAYSKYEEKGNFKISNKTWKQLKSDYFRILCVTREDSWWTLLRIAVQQWNFKMPHSG